MNKELIPETTMKWRQVYRIKPKEMLARKFRMVKNAGSIIMVCLSLVVL